MPASAADRWCIVQNLRTASRKVLKGDSRRIKQSVAPTSEAAAQAQDAGIAPQTLIDVLQAGGGAGVALDRITPFLSNGDREAMAFSIANAAKDLDYYCQMSVAARAPHAVANGISLALSQVVEAGAGGANLPELAALLRTSRTVSA